jgi:hypothetical protein
MESAETTSSFSCRCCQNSSGPTISGINRVTNVAYIFFWLLPVQKSLFVGRAPTCVSLSHTDYKTIVSTLVLCHYTCCIQLPIKLHFICIFLLLHRMDTLCPIHLCACSHHSSLVTLTGGLYSKNTTPHIDLGLWLYMSSTLGSHTHFIRGNKCVPTNVLTVILVPMTHLAIVSLAYNTFGGVSSSYLHL